MRHPRLVAAVVGVAAMIGCAHVHHLLHGQDVPADLDTSTTRTSATGAYRVSYASAVEPVPVHRLHAWTVRVATADGAPVEGAAIAVDGDMPGHGHGLPTSPRVTRELGDGAYLVEGVKFHMDGWWVVDLDITAAGVRDTVRFDLLLED